MTAVAGLPAVETHGFQRLGCQYAVQIGIQLFERVQGFDIGGETEPRLPM